MKKLFSALLISCTFASYGQSLRFDRNYGGVQDEAANFIKQIDSKHSLIGGFTKSFGQGLADWYILKIDDKGDTLWTRTFGGWDSESGTQIESASNGGFFLCQTTRSFGSGGGDIYIVRIDKDGNKLWDKTLGSWGDEYTRSVKRTNDGGYLIAGFTSSKGNGNWDMYLVRVDSLGNQLWDKTFGGTDADDAWNLMITSDNHILMTGGTRSGSAGLTDLYLVKTDMNGNLVWSKKFGGAGEDNGAALAETKDGYLIAGSTESKGMGSSDAWLIKTDKNGNLLFDTTYGGSGKDYFRSVVKTPGGSFVLAGGIYNSVNSSGDCYIVKTDSAGKYQFQYTFGGAGFQEAGFVACPTDGELDIVGTTYVAGWNNQVYYSKVDYPKELTVSVREAGHTAISGPSPNPFRDQAVIETGSGNLGKETVCIISDITGRQIGRESTRNSRIIIPNKGYKPGLYIYTIETEGRRLGSGKLMIEP
jgi:hypothetical protein